MENKKPLAYLTKENCLWMQDPKDEDYYMPNPNAEGSYHYTYCQEIGCIPIYDPRLIEHFEMQKILNFFSYENQNKDE